MYCVLFIKGHLYVLAGLLALKIKTFQKLITPF